MTRPAPQDILRTVFGYEQFRGHQEAIVQTVLDGGDAVVLMPTGGGKSLCYQIPALALDGVGLVVSPLIALMEDQVTALRELGVDAAYINSSLPRAATDELERMMVDGQLDLVYVAPERLMTPFFLNLLERTKLALIAIDEAHCVSQWGHDFRPEYLQLAELAQRFPKVPRMALTATADEPTRKDILERLHLSSSSMFVSSFDRPNIRYTIVAKKSPRKQLLSFLRERHPVSAGIVYCLTRKKTEQTAEWLEREGFRAAAYHAGMTADARRATQERFLREEGLIVVATVAFGMGIDKPDVRFVAHLDTPRSIESYYQETGRAGRDGLPSDAWMSYGLADIMLHRSLIDGSHAPDQQKRIERQRLGLLLGLCETTRCRRQVLLEYFGDELDQPCGNCDTCLSPVETWDGTEAAQKALSCVYRTGQRFGSMYVIDVLTGKTNDRIRRLGHDELSTFGIGKDMHQGEWHSVIRQLVALGLLDFDHQYGSLLLSSGARAVLRGEKEVHLRRDPVAARPRAAAKGSGGRKSAKPRAGTEELSEQDMVLFEKLRMARRELAEKRRVPPYVIFHDATLIEMAKVRPATMGELAELHGVGATKLKKYGETFLSLLQPAP